MDAAVINFNLAWDAVSALKLWYSQKLTVGYIVEMWYMIYN